MMRCCGSGGGGEGGGGLINLRRREIQGWIRDYDKVQRLAVRLIYGQIGCALIGSSLGTLYSGVLLVNLGISLFALVAIESSSQSLARTYAVLLFSSIFLDLAWFSLFSRDIWHIPSEIYGKFVRFSVKFTLGMQIAGFSLRLFSSLLWIQMYRLGVSYIDNSVPRDTDADLRNSFLSPTPATPSIARRPSGADDVVGGSIYDPAYYSSLFEDGRDDSYLFGVGQSRGVSAADSVNGAETSHPNPPMGISFHAKDEERKLQIV